MGDVMQRQVVLAIDTSTDMLCCAVGAIAGGTVAASPVNGDRAGAPVDLLALGDHACRRRSNVELTNTVRDTLKAAGLTVADVDAVLVGRGPGSFTGVRIGIATAKGIARGMGVPLYGASTLDACAWHVWAGGVRGVVGIVADAMRGEVYPGIYRLEDEGAVRTFAAETVAKAPAAARAWATMFASRTDGVTLAGDGLTKYHDVFADAGFTSFAGTDTWHPTGEGLLRAFVTARLASDAPYAAHMTGEAATVLPIYTRLSDAEENERLRLGMPEPASTQVSGVADQLADSHAQLRPAGINDVDAIATLEAAAYAESSHRAWSAAEIREDLVGSHTAWWVAHDVGRVVGFACATLAGDSGDVTDVVVASTHRRRGLGRRLLTRVCYDMQVLGATTATLEVAEDNIAARALYASAGFVETGRRRGYYGAGHDALVMRATLPLAGDDVPRTTSADRASGCDTKLADACRVGHQVPTEQKSDARDHKTDSLANTAQIVAPHHESPVSNEPFFSSNIEQKSANVTKMFSDSVYDATNFPVADKQLTHIRTSTAPDTNLSARKARIAASSPLVLAIETSCDETAMAVIDGTGAILANVVATQIDFHARFGGVVPEIASRKHTEAIVGVYDEVMARAGERLGVGALTAADLAAVGVTAGPGLVGALVVGVAFAKGLCLATGAALIPVHHLEGHLVANLFAAPDLTPPFVASLVSGGNTMLVHVRAWGDYAILGTTIDDAVGEAFDKVAKALGLGYPGGPVISKLAAEGNPRAISFPRAMMRSGDYRFSLSGLKTAVITYIESAAAAGRAINLPDLAASFTAAVVDVQVAKATSAVEEYGVNDFCVGGGVAANPQLRAAYAEAFGERGVRVTAAPLAVCGDNGAMIAVAALRNLRAGVTADLALDADPNAPLGAWTSADVAPMVDAAAWPDWAALEGELFRERNTSITFSN